VNEYVRTIDGLPLIVRLILAFPVFDGLVYGIYRIAKGRLIVGILWIVLGIPFLWVVDLISILFYGKVTILV
jgi:hypothetical protein